MQTIPEGVPTATGEGIDLSTAVRDAAAKLGLGAGDVAYTFDRNHFRSANGSSMARSTVKIIAWGRDGSAAADAAPSPVTSVAAPAPAPVEAPAEAPAREWTPAPERPGRIPAPTSTTDASEFAANWFRELTRLMDIPSTVTATGDSERVRIKVAAEGAGRLIGRKGTTLGAIRHLLALALADRGNPIVDVDVDDPREDRGEARRDAPREERRDDRRDGRGERRDDRREGRPERRDDRREGRPERRDDRREGRPERRDDRRDDRRERGGGGTYPEEKLQEIARRAAEKAISTGKPITINLQLNSYDRRIVHLEVAELKGVESLSVIKDDVKYVQVVPAQG